MIVRISKRRLRQHSRAVMLSLIWHGAVFATLTQLRLPTPAPRRPIFEEFVRPHQRTLVYYKPPKVEVKEAAPVTRIGPAPVPQARRLDLRTAIAETPKPRSDRELLAQGTALPELKTDVPLPSVIARTETSALPPPPKAVARNFVAPPPSAQQPKLALPTEVNLEANTGALATIRTSPTNVPSLSTSTDLSRPDLPQAPTPSPGNASANLVITSVDPAKNVEAVPQANRAGAFATAPKVGPTSSGTPGPDAIVTPNVAVREPVKIPEPPQNTVIYSERVRVSSQTVLSTPLRPSSRSIPRALEQRFRGRNVYAIVIPIENLPSYGGDWILWFAESTPSAGRTPLMRAPVPFRKVEEVHANQPAVVRVQIAAVLGKDGRVRNASILPATSSSATPLSAEAQAWVIEDLNSWEFRPATSNGVAVEIDGVFEIPFRLPTAK